MLASSKDKFKFLILIIVSMNVRILDRVGLRPQLKGNEKRVSGIARPPAALALLRSVYLSFWIVHLCPGASNRQATK
jgi:hypothetical protein